MIGSKRKHVETESDKPSKIKKHGGAERNDVGKPKYSKTEKKPFEKFVKKDKKPFDKFEKKEKKPFDKFKKKSGGQENTGDRPGSKPKFMTKGIPYPSKQEEGSDAPPNWTEYKKKKKELRETRRVSKITKSKTKPEAVDVIAKAKVLSETLRRKKGTVEERAAQTEELHGLLRVKGHYKQLALAHDTTRIIQWLLKFASPHIRMEVSKELMELVVPMIQSKYARNCVKRILKYGSGETRNQVLTALHGHVVKLSAHALAAPILDYAYGEIANRKQKLLLQQEFYGDIYRTSKDATVNSLADTFKASPEMKAAMLGATKANLVRVINKNVHDCGLVHAVLLEFLKECSSDDRAELISTLSPLIAPLSNSKPGVKAAIICVWHGSNKDKKTILKVVKEHVVSLSSHEHGHQLILALLSSVDDTVLMGKALLTTLLKEAATIAKEEWGRKVLLWLVAPLDPAYFHPHLCSWLTAGAAAGGSKKPAPQRAAELLTASLPALLEALTADPAFWLGSGALGLLTVAILKAASGEQLKLALESVARHVSRVDWTLIEEEGKEVKGVEHAGIHMCLKKLAQRDKLNAGKEPTLGEALCANLTSEVVESWITTNRGCFLLLIIFENNSEDVQKSLKTLLLPQAKLLKKQTTAGAKILLSKIKA